jgi:hypothetical protein
MGLDNIPHQYPCSTQGTAVLVPRLDAEGKAWVQDDGTPMQSIDCQATQACGGCSWQNAEPPIDGKVTGMFGTDCWYRGKYGNVLLSEFGDYNETENRSFYGSDEGGAYKTAEDCLGLSKYIDGLIEKTDWTRVVQPESAKSGLEYASWWLRWVSEEADGSDCWY